ncbi:MAG: hypothetical protein ACYCU0_14750 [Solirubrobacteraceae bacterium]
MLCWLAEQGGARSDQIEALLGAGTRTVQRTLARLRDRQLIHVRRILADEPAWVTPTGRGLRACGSPFGVWTPRLDLVRHHAAVNDVRIHVQRRDPCCEWVCERQLAKDRGGRAAHLPDAVVLTQGRRVAVEVELTVKSRRRVEAIIDELSGCHEAVLYFCAPACRRVIEALAEGGRWPELGIRELPVPPRGWSW